LPRFQPGVVTNPNGRPRKLIAAKHLPTIKELAAKGVRVKDICRAIEISEPTWTKCLAEQPEVRDAFDSGRQVMHDALVSKLFERAMKGDLVPNLFLLKCVFSYREMGDESGEGRPNIVINLPGAAASVQTYSGRTIEPEREQPALPAPTKRTRRG